MEANVIPAVSPIQPVVASGEQAESLAGPRVVRKVFYPPYCNPPISDYRKFWYSNASAFWASFRVQPGDGGTVNQLGSNPVTNARPLSRKWASATRSPPRRRPCTRSTSRSRRVRSA